VTNNPNFKPSVAKRAAVGKLKMEMVTLEEMNALNERAKLANLKLLAPATKRVCAKLLSLFPYLADSLIAGSDVHLVRSYKEHPL